MYIQDEQPADVVGEKRIDCPICPECHFGLYVRKNRRYEEDRLSVKRPPEWFCRKCKLDFY